MASMQRPPNRKHISYNNALLNKEEWRHYMEEPAQQLENILYGLKPNYDDQCLVCGAAVSSTHILGQKHWRNLWNKLGMVPCSSVAVRWDKEWVQKFETREGTYLFNHITGEQAFQDELGSVNAAPPPYRHFSTHQAQQQQQQPLHMQNQSQPMQPLPQLPTTPYHADAFQHQQTLQPHASWPEQPQPQMPMQPVHLQPQQPMQQQLYHRQLEQPLQPMEAQQHQGHDVQHPLPLRENDHVANLDHWHWKALVAKPAKNLAALTSQQPCSMVCSVCQVPMAPIEEHLSSWQHRINLRSRMTKIAADTNYELEAEKLDSPAAPWMQTFGNVTFNHLTLELCRHG